MLMSLWTDYLSQYITADSWVLNAKDAAKLIMIAVTPSLPSKLCKHVIHFRKVRKLLKSSIMWLILSGSINSVGESEFVSISPGFGRLWSVVLFPSRLGGCPASCSLVTYKTWLPIRETTCYFVSDRKFWFFQPVFYYFMEKRPKLKAVSLLKNPTPDSSAKGLVKGTAKRTKSLI